MMQGITSLPGAQQGPQMQQGPMPGQSAPAQVMPQQQGGIAPPITAPLEKLPPQQLLTMYNNPQDMTPKWAVATAYAKAIEQARLMQMAQGQSAMAQGMAQAQQPPVVQQIMSQPMPQETQYAAHGGVMHGYAGGGAVSFAGGGSTPFGRWWQPIKESMREAMSPSEQYQLASEIAKRYAPAAGLGGLFMEQSDAALQRAQDVMSRLGSMSVEDMRALLEQDNYGMEGRRVRSEPVDAAPSAPTDYGTKATEDRGYKPSTNIPAAGRTGIANLPGAGKPTTSQDVGKAEMAAYQQAIDNQASNLRTMSQPSDEERLARQQARQADVARLEEERKAAREFREGSAKQYADVERQVNLPFLENNAAIAALGANISGRRGETARGILQGIGAIEANKQARLDAARKEMREDTRTAMQMDSVNRQLAVAQQEKAYADMRGDREASLAAEQKIAELQQGKLKLAYEYAVKKEELKNQGITAQAHMISAQKPDPMTALINMVRQGTTLSPLEAYTQIRQADQLKQNFYDKVSDNATRRYDKWAENPMNMTATADQRKAVMDEFLNQELELARRFGVPGVPAEPAAPANAAPGTRHNPIKLD